MKVLTQSGTFDVLIKGISIEKDVMTLNAQLGVWYGTIVLTDDDLWFFKKVFFRPSIFIKVLKIPFHSIIKRNKK